MNKLLKFLIAFIIGLIVMWLCYRVFRLEQEMTTIISIFLTAAVYSVIDKITSKK